ncbi:11297_t:CDS:2 [Funneliformis mosseae]|uniref:11297_t:CDS:1 n=1 Tax=Funneliformis mosseae TaxID=27381 RepID=A0A9N9FLN9_FUNMO|nr:11297_t:CDS:2 [Funneliformis mosseae]
MWEPLIGGILELASVDLNFEDVVAIITSRIKISIRRSRLDLLISSAHSSKALFVSPKIKHISFRKEILGLNKILFIIYSISFSSHNYTIDELLIKTIEQFSYPEIVDFRTGSTSWLQFAKLPVRKPDLAYGEWPTGLSARVLLRVSFIADEPNLIIITKQLPSQLAELLLVAWCLAVPCPVSPDFDCWHLQPSEASTSNQSCEEDIVIEAEDDDLDEPDLQSHDNEEDSQRTRHPLEMLKWSVVNLEIFDGEQSDDELRSIARILQSLKKKG